MTNNFPSALEVSDDDKEAIYQQQLNEKETELTEAQQQLSEGRRWLSTAQGKYHTKKAEVDALKLEIESGGEGVLEATKKVVAATAELQVLHDEAALLQETSVPIMSDKVDKLELEVDGLRTLLGINGMYSDDQARALAAGLGLELKEIAKQTLAKAQESDQKMYEKFGDLERAKNKGLLSPLHDAPLKIIGSGRRVEGFTLHGLRYGANAESAIKWALERLFDNAKAELEREREAAREAAMTDEERDRETLEEQQQAEQAELAKAMLQVAPYQDTSITRPAKPTATQQWGETIEGSSAALPVTRY